MPKILLIDDDPDIRKIALISLEQVGGFDVSTASCGEDGLELAEARPFDLILLDVMMPGLDGPECLSRLQSDAKTSDVPVVFMTATVQQSEVRRYLGLGATGVIAKPFDPMLLPSQVRRILDEAT